MAGQINARTQIAGGAAIIGKILSATIDGTAWIDPPSSSLPPQSSSTAEHALVSNGTSAFWGTLANIVGSIAITKIGTVSTDINHVLISGGSSVLNYWGTLANIAGKLSITSIGTVELNLNHVLISGDTVVPNYWGTLANIAGKLSITSIGTVELNANHVLISGGTVVPNFWGTLANIAGNLSITSIATVERQCKSRFNFRWYRGPNFWGTLANIAGNLAASKITSGIFDIARIPEIPLTSIASVDTDVGHVIVAGGSLAENYWGTLANIVGNLSITQLATVATDANHVLISGGGSTIAPNYWGGLANIEGNLPASKITSGVFDIARIPEIPLSRIASVDSNVSHVIVAGGSPCRELLGHAGKHSWQTSSS